MGHFEVNFGLKGYVSQQCIWAVRYGNGHATTLPLAVFIHRNFVADFIRLKLHFIQKTQKSLFKAPIRGNIPTLSIAFWKARGRLPIRHN